MPPAEPPGPRRSPWKVPAVPAVGSIPLKLAVGWTLPAPAFRL